VGGDDGVVSAGRDGVVRRLPGVLDDLAPGLTGERLPTM
jgi:hypothetical protein